MLNTYYDHVENAFIQTVSIGTNYNNALKLSKEAYKIFINTITSNNFKTDLISYLDFNEHYKLVASYSINI